MTSAWANGVVTYSSSFCRSESRDIVAVRVAGSQERVSQELDKQKKTDRKRNERVGGRNAGMGCRYSRRCLG